MSIPASNLVNVIPSVLGAGGNPLDMNGMILTNNIACPAGAPTKFTSYDAVATFFGANSKEARMARVYFDAFTNASKTPSTLFFAFYGGGGPPPPETSTYYYLSDRASAVDHSHIFHLNPDLATVNRWDGAATDVLWAALPLTLDSTTDRNAGIIATAAFVYVFGFVSGVPHIWMRATDASVGGGAWDEIVLPTDTTFETETWNFGGFPWVAVDLNDIVSILGINNHSFAYWTGTSGSWSPILVLYQGGEGSFSPQPCFVWAADGRSALVVYDRHAGNNYALIGDVWNPLQSNPEGVSISGFFSFAGSDLWGMDATPGSTGILENIGDVWQAEAYTGLFDFAPNQQQGTCFPTGGRAMLVSQVEFQGPQYGLVTDGGEVFSYELNVNPVTGVLQYQGVDVNTLPSGWLGSPGTGIGEMLPDGSILHSSTFGNAPPIPGGLAFPELLFSGMGGMAMCLAPLNHSDTGTWSSPDGSAVVVSGQGTTEAMLEPQVGYSSGAPYSVQLDVTGGVYTGQSFSCSGACWNPASDFAMNFSNPSPVPGETGVTVTGQNCGHPGGTMNGTQPTFMTWGISPNCTITSGQNTDVLTFSVNEDANPGDSIVVTLAYQYIVINVYNFNAPDGNIAVG
jgi:hypothetical protein